MNMMKKKKRTKVNYALSEWVKRVSKREKTKTKTKERKKKKNKKMEKIKKEATTRDKNGSRCFSNCGCLAVVLYSFSTQVALKQME